MVFKSEPGQVSPSYLHHLVASPGDIDELGHVSNIVYLRWVQDAAAAHSLAVGWTLERYKEVGAVWVVRKHEITYYAPAYAGDEVVCRTWVSGWKGASSPRETEIKRVKDDQLLARCTTLWALIDIETGRPCRITAEMREDYSREPTAG